MLDRLLGRAELKARIEELEEENHHLERQLEAEAERRSEAASAKQTAEERVNRLEDRVAELEDRAERAEREESSLEFRGTESLRGDRLRAVLDRLRSVDTGEEGALTAVVSDQSPAAVREAFGERSALVDRAAPCLAVTDDAGLVSAALAAPRLPDPFVEWGDGFTLEESWFQPTGRLTVALVRSDRFAVGVFEDGRPTEIETVESEVKGTHSKGGFSQSRFERRRDEQVEAHLERCRDVLASYDGPLVVLGERTVLDDVADGADYTAAVDATGEPAEALEDAFRSFFTTRLYLV